MRKHLLTRHETFASELQLQDAEPFMRTRYESEDIASRPLPPIEVCYVMMCYVMSCCVMLYYVMLCYVMLCYVMLCYVMLHYVMLCYVMLCYVILCHVMLCHVMLYYVMLCYVMFCMFFKFNASINFYCSTFQNCTYILTF